MNPTMKMLTSMEVAGEKIDELINNEEYKNGSLEERYELAEKTLTDLKRSGYIKGLRYDEKNKMFTFQYTGGGLGGVQLKPRWENDSGLPMNGMNAIDAVN